LGWIGGTYATPSLSLWSQISLQLIHYLPVALLFLLGMHFLTGNYESRDWGRRGLITFCVFIKVVTVIWIVIGFTHFLGLEGPHTFDDWFPIGVTNAGSGMLLGLFVAHRDRSHEQTRQK